MPFTPLCCIQVIASMLTKLLACVVCHHAPFTHALLRVCVNTPFLLLVCGPRSNSTWTSCLSAPSESPRQQMGVLMTSMYVNRQVLRIQTRVETILTDSRTSDASSIKIQSIVFPPPSPLTNRALKWSESVNTNADDLLCKQTRGGSSDLILRKSVGLVQSCFSIRIRLRRDSCWYLKHFNEQHQQSGLDQSTEALRLISY